MEGKKENKWENYAEVQLHPAMKCEKNIAKMFQNVPKISHDIADIAKNKKLCLLFEWRLYTFRTVLEFLRERIAK